MDPFNSFNAFTLAEVVAIGFAAGLLAGAFGVGGGILSTPMLRVLIGVSPHVAVGTTLAVIIPTAVVGAINYVKQKQILRQLAIFCGIPAVFGTVLGSRATHFIDGTYLMVALAVLMVLVGLDFTTGFGARLKHKAETITQVSELDGSSKVIALVMGFFVGILSGLLGVGGGFILIPCYCYVFHAPIKVAFGTSLLVVAIVAIPGTIVHALHDHVNWPLALFMLLGSVPGASLGSHFSLKAKDKVLKTSFGCVLLLLAAFFGYRELTIE